MPEGSTPHSLWGRLEAGDVGKLAIIPIAARPSLKLPTDLHRKIRVRTTRTVQETTACTEPTGAVLLKKPTHLALCAEVFVRGDTMDEREDLWL